MKFAITDSQTIFNIINLESDAAILSIPDTYYQLPIELADTQIDYIVSNYIVLNGEFIKVSAPRPTRMHRYSLELAAWVIPIEYKNQFIVEKKSEIDQIRSNLSTQPIIFDSKPLDADITTVSINLPGKLKELEAREILDQPMPVEQMFWKDADNNIHTWTDTTVYRNWLLGYSIAIAERTTYLYSKAWEKKAEIDALTDTTDILNYNPTTGW